MPRLRKSRSRSEKSDPRSKKGIQGQKKEVRSKKVIQGQKKDLPLFNEKAHHVGCRLPYAQATDAKSLYDCVISEAPTTTEKRSLVNIRAMQECLAPDQYHWVPTFLMKADGRLEAETGICTVAAGSGCSPERKRSSEGPKEKYE
jgi:hypothetical protein